MPHSVEMKLKKVLPEYDNKVQTVIRVISNLGDQAYREARPSDVQVLQVQFPECRGLTRSRRTVDTTPPWCVGSRQLCWNSPDLLSAQNGRPSWYQRTWWSDDCTRHSSESTSSWKTTRSVDGVSSSSCPSANQSAQNTPVLAVTRCHIPALHAK